MESNDGRLTWVTGGAEGASVTGGEERRRQLTTFRHVTALPRDHAQPLAR
jgi:hypothetical protein